MLTQNKRRKLYEFWLFQIILGNSWLALSSVTQTNKQTNKKAQTLHKFSVDSAYWPRRNGSYELSNMSSIFTLYRLQERYEEQTAQACDFKLFWMLFYVSNSRFFFTCLLYHKNVINKLSRRTVRSCTQMAFCRDFTFEGWMGWGVPVKFQCLGRGGGRVGSSRAVAAEPISILLSLNTI